MQDFVFGAYSSFIRIEASFCDFYAFGGVVVDFFQGYSQFMYYRWVLYFASRVQWFWGSFWIFIQFIEIKAVKGIKWVFIFIYIYVIWVKIIEGSSGAVVGKEDIEGVGVIKEGGEGGMRVFMKGVVKGVIGVI